MADSGTIVSVWVLTEAPVEAAPRPLFASAFRREFSAAALASEVAVELLEELKALPAAVPAPPDVLDVPLAPLLPLTEAPPVVPLGAPAAAVVLVEEGLMEKALTAAPLFWVPLSAPPEVLIQTSLSVSGLCQKLGCTSIMT